MFKLSKWATLLGALALALAVLPTPVFAAVSENFDGYADTTLAENLTTPGVTFVGAGYYTIRDVSARSTVMNGMSLGNWNCDPSPLTLTFNTTQGGVSLDWITGGGDFQILGFVEGSQVFDQTFTGAYILVDFEGSAAVNAEFDELVLTSTIGYCLSIDNLVTSDVGVPAPAGGAAEPVPGCDVLLTIPSTAVGGTFVSNALLYWMPGELIAPATEIAAGQSARVIGMDASGQYYKILWVCDFVWVPVSAIGPNYDDVWHGAPLPTAVVD